ncbi:Mov34/MPN/PAD-1 family protein [Noviherbaspirillum pedocola]|uniref:Mov34/MPN/PAD-1 family protein n=1 Tax=Noviherbaspirillum pedocola TaxID=2801341 RepID=A0A934ST00_9BURK|nr:Mov34/MPN/PAD-1 family protein [Noviherbaspirillum pedocola]MBK4734688.1 Mov34/MPN/PAD-1 family protein [Noviherbaspirillum pedocola]
MGKCLLEYRIPDAAWSLEFCADAIAVLQQHVQKGPLSRESVGQLYTRDLTKPTIRVEVATVLPPARNSYAHVRFDPKKLAAERAALFKQGLHCLGFWHSHPESAPRPSKEDDELAADHARAARGILSGLVFAIVGNAPFPSGLAVWVHDGRAMWAARPEKLE